MIYLDSCALVKLVVVEEETRALERYLRERVPYVVTSEIAITEIVRVVRRSCYDAQRRLIVDEALLHDRLSAAGDLLDRVDHILVDTDTFRRAGMYADDPHLGSLDAIHLVCAIEVGEALTSVVTYDKALARAAAERGLPVEQPR